MMKLGIIGTGLIGGSIALDLRNLNVTSRVLGMDQNSENLKDALTLGIIDEIADLKTMCEQCDLVIVAIPVSASLEILKLCLDDLSPTGTLMDVGSTKGKIWESIQGHPRRKSLVLTHPMAGTEYSGPSAAHRGLFLGKAAVICNEQENEENSLSKIRFMYETLGMRLISMNANDHDLHVAYVSHLSHISSFLLANTVLAKERDEKKIFDLASGGFESTVRLAKSSPEMWAPIFEQNQVPITRALGDYIELLKEFHTQLSKGNFDYLKNKMQQANEIRRVLSQIQMTKASATPPREVRK
ncbi:MAG: prephenate dehydrogenase [Bacteriovoracaceae bacterium]|nr:prephenate dehydrogenase [Bacteriovoracaceae bacterium]